MLPVVSTFFVLAFRLNSLDELSTNLPLKGNNDVVFSRNYWNVNLAGAEMRKEKCRLRPS